MKAGGEKIRGTKSVCQCREREQGGGGFCVKTKRNRLSKKYGELAKVIITSSLALKVRVAGLDLVTRLTAGRSPHTAQPVPVFPAPLTWCTLAFLPELQQCLLL